MQLSPSIFKAYDIRGIIDETLDPSIAKLIGQALGTEMRELGETEAVIGRDGRLSGPSLIAALTEGLLSTGMNVIDLGMVATPMVYFAANQTLNGKSQPAQLQRLQDGARWRCDLWRADSETTQAH